MISLTLFPAAVPNEVSGLSLSVSMLVVLGSAKLLAELFERIGQPGIIGEIVAGVVIGPGVMRWISPNESLSFLAELGVMFLLFRVGLEVKSDELIKVGKVAALVGVMGVVLPMFCGWALYRFSGRPQLESLFVGAALTATSVGITAKFLAARGVLSDVAGNIILAAAVIDDVLALLVLGVVSGVARGGVNLLELGLTSGFAVLFIVLVVRWGRKTAAHVIPTLDRSLRIGESQFALALVMMFGLAALSAKAGVAPVIGSFLAGMVMSESATERVHDLTAGVAELLVPFFLVNIGLHLDVSVFAHWPTLALALVVLAIAVATKVVGCGLGALSYGRQTALRVGLGMVPRGEFCFVVLQIGLALNVVPPQTYGVVVFIAVVSTVLTPPLLNAAFAAKPQKQPA